MTADEQCGFEENADVVGAIDVKIITIRLALTEFLQPTPVDKRKVQLGFMTYPRSILSNLSAKIE